MLIKTIDDKTALIGQLEALLPLADPSKQKIIRRELLNLKKGIRNEKQIAWLLDFVFKSRKNTLILHDLRLKFDGDVAQIDHLLINPGAIVLLESKYFSQKVEIDPHGNWVAHYGDRRYPLPSPLEQNNRHKILLQRILEHYDLLPKRLGIRVNLPIEDYVLISTNCILEGNIPPNVIKADRAATTVEEGWDARCDRYLGLNTFKVVANMITHNEMRRIAATLLDLHRPFMIDYAAKHGIEPAPVDTDLLNHLSQVRKKLATQKDLPPQKILSDEILRAFACKKPRSPLETKQLPGMTEILFAGYGYRFLNAVLDFERRTADAVR